jgi:hypothetical protein
MRNSNANKFGSTVKDYLIIRDGKIIDPVTGIEREPLKHVIPLPAKKSKKTQVR